MSTPTIIQLSIWDALESASARPLDTDFALLLAQVDELIALVPMSERLAAAGEAIARLGAIYGERCALRLAEIDYLNHPEREPVLSLDAFDLYVRQTSIVDLEQFIESPELPEVERGYTRSEVLEIVAEAVASREVTVTNSIEPSAIVEEVLGLAHGENIELWAQRIREAIAEYVEMSLLELQARSRLSLVDVWLGLLLGETDCRVWRQSGNPLDIIVDFYSIDGLLVGLDD